MSLVKIDEKALYEMSGDDILVAFPEAFFSWKVGQSTDSLPCWILKFFLKVEKVWASRGRHFLFLSPFHSKREEGKRPPSPSKMTSRFCYAFLRLFSWYSMLYIVQSPLCPSCKLWVNDTSTTLFLPRAPPFPFLSLPPSPPQPSLFSFRKLPLAPGQ